CRAETGECSRPVRPLDRVEAASDEVQGLVPRCLAERRHHFGVINNATTLAVLAAHGAGQWPLGIVLRSADQRTGQSVCMEGVIPPIATLDTQTALIAGTVAALGPEDAIVLDVIGQGAPHAAVRTDTVNGGGLRARHERQRQRLVGQRSRRTRGDALAA